MKRIFVLFCFLFLIAGFFYAESFCSITFSGDESAKNAKIYINDTEYGHIPKTVNTLIPGIYRIKLEKDHFKSQDFFIELKEDENITLNLEMEKQNTDKTEKTDTQ